AIRRGRERRLAADLPGGASPAAAPRGARPRRRLRLLRRAHRGGTRAEDPRRGALPRQGGADRADSPRRRVARAARPGTLTPFARATRARRPTMADVSIHVKPNGPLLVMGA